MHDSILSRRSAIGILASGAAAAALEIHPARAQFNVRIRENITTFAANPTKLAALKNGVAVMKQRSATNPDDPAGWNYWASSHGTPNSVPSALTDIYDHCRHSYPGHVEQHFFSWHRAFLYYFEQTLRAASGDITLNLPYWNWYSTPTIPPAFTAPANATNPLFHPRGHNTVGPLSLSPFSHADFKSSPAPYPQFTEDLEGDPHGTVHNNLGGDMGSILTSAIDPIFWLHHCNVDRLWNVWVNQGNTNPPLSDSWSDQSFTYDVAGTMKKTAGQVTNTVIMLGYKYDQEATPLQPHLIWNIVLATTLIAKPLVVPGPEPVEQVMSPETLAMAQNRNTTIASALSGGFSLGTQSSQVKFPLAAENRSRVLSFATSPTAPAASELQDIDLVLEGVEITPEGKNGGYAFRVCVAVPKGHVSQETLDRQCVGEFGSFEISVVREHARKMGASSGGGITLRFPLGSAIKAAGSRAFDGESVPVTFVAQHASLPAGQGNKTYVTVRSAHLELAKGASH